MHSAHRPPIKQTSKQANKQAKITNTRTDKRDGQTNSTTAQQHNSTTTVIVIAIVIITNKTRRSSS